MALITTCVGYKSLLFSTTKIAFTLASVCRYPRQICYPRHRHPRLCDNFHGRIMQLTTRIWQNKWAEDLPTFRSKGLITTVAQKRPRLWENRHKLIEAMFWSPPFWRGYRSLPSPVGTPCCDSLACISCAVQYMILRIYCVCCVVSLTCLIPLEGLPRSPMNL